MKIVFLSLKQVQKIHDDQLNHYGGRAGVRDIGLVDSAVQAPRATFDGQFLYNSLWKMAAAYLYGIANNHGFVDGNKRTGAMAAYVFLFMNGYVLEMEPSEFEDFVVRVVEEKLSKEFISEFLEAHSAKLPVLET